MKKLYLFFITIGIVFSLKSQDLELKLNSGNFTVQKDIDCDFSVQDPYRIFFFEQLPTDIEKGELKNLGIDFLYYLPKNIFVVFLQKDISEDIFEKYNIISVNKILPSYKIDNKLMNETFPEWCLKDDLLHIKVLFYNNVNFSTCIKQISLLSNKIESINESAKSLVISIDSKKINSISNLFFVSYIEPIDPPAEPENKSGGTLHRSNIINTNFSAGRKYNGDGINVMMHDDGYVGPHIDRQGRVDQSFCSGCSVSGSDHGDHVSGTIMGAGNLDPLAKGMADGSFLYVLGYSTNNYYNYVPNLYSNYNVVITSASYSNGCNAGYTSLSSDLDLQINTYPNLMHVFSAGNSGSSDCGYGAGSSWGNVTGGHKQAKNVITVANLTSTSLLASSSSRGPATDGRIKPDISAKGSSVYSTQEDQTYGTKTGTSMSCPGISGVLAQLYQAYKELNGGTDPSSALMKCILLNSADDIGNPGPDFKHGWGQVNSYRAVKMIENNNYFSSSVSQGNINPYIISVPSGVSKVKVMVYWHDKEANTSASISLVNDIDIQLITPAGTTFNPWVLDPTPNSSNLNQDAVRNFDGLNNMEQVTIDNPSAGNYTLNVEGYAIPFGPQEFYVTYEFITDDIELTYPIGGESLVPGEQEYIRWDSYQSGTLSIEYTVDGGNNWYTITNSANSNNQYYSWTVPNYITDDAKIRISSNNSVSSSYSSFTIIEVPSNLNVYWPCPDSINVNWNSVNGATSYEVSMLGQKYMDSIFTTTNTNVWIINPNTSVTDSWFSVSSKYNNGKGRRAIAVNAQSINSMCSGYGCTDPTAYNYTSLAIVNDGSCCYVSACTDITAINYDSLACFDDGSCIAPILGCTNSSATNFDPNANTTIAFGGATDNTFGTGGYFNGNQHLNFDSYKNCVIKSSVIYAQTSNTITFELRNSTGAVLDDTTLTIVAGQQRIPLNLDVPVGTGFQLGVSAANSNLYRNNASASYPYNIASAINITSSSATSTPFGYYYFFYDIEVETPCDVYSNVSWDCDGQGNCSDPGTGNGQFSNLSQCQSSCIVPSWDCDAQGNCYDPGTGIGMYSSFSSCESECVNVSVSVIGLNNFKIYPNPSSDIFNVEFSSNNKKTIEVKIMNLIGEIIFIDNLNKFNGEYKQTINLVFYSKGIYLLQIDTEDGIINKKLILQ